MISIGTPEETTRVLATTDIRLVVLDLQRMTPTVSQIIAACRTARRTMPLLVITGDATDLGAEGLRRVGADALLCKPLELGLMRATVRKLLSPAPTHA